MQIDFHIIDTGDMTIIGRVAAVSKDEARRRIAGRFDAKVLERVRLQGDNRQPARMTR